MDLRAVTHLRLVFVAIVVALALFGCRGDNLSDDEVEQIRDIFLSGLEMQHDQYVRAESVRSLDLTGDPRLASMAGELVDDPEPVVRVAALRTLLRSGQREAPYSDALDAFRAADNANERYHILDIALTEGDERVRRAVLSRAHRDNSPRVRLRALQRGLLQEIEQAEQDGDDQHLDRELLPELGEYVDDSNPEIAATALRALLDYGRPSRADRFIDRFSDDDRSLDERLHAGRVLLRARVEDAEQPFRELIALAESDERDSLGRPLHDIDDELVRIAELGLTALGDTDYVERAQKHLSGAAPFEAKEALEALGHNPAEDAAIALRSDIRSARADVRQRALSLYGQRDDARSDVIFSALRSNDFETRQMSIAILSEQFPDQWLDFLNEQLHSADPDRLEQGLVLLQQILRTDTDDHLEILAEFVDRLEQLATDDDLQLTIDDDPENIDELHSRITNRAAFVLFQISEDEGAYREVIRENPDRQTRAAYLEYLATHQPGEHADVLRDHLHDDLFVLRLMAAAGLWNAYGEAAKWPFGDDETDEQADEDEQ